MQPSKSFFFSRFIPQSDKRLASFDIVGSYNCIHSSRWLSVLGMNTFPLTSCLSSVCVCVCVCSVVWSCLTLCAPTDSSHTPLSMEFFQARILEWVAISYCRGSSRPRDQTYKILNICRFHILDCAYVYAYLLGMRRLGKDSRKLEEERNH